ncbi:hypothetical protein KSZ_71820 [Dictyobacter formicarum]|uniref:Secreted protein n=1 Tax=Dictyobacter formicarum TaxID=2778368 RepID=A0ABQ3VVP9_9CHLR|nr:hypothetical protein KSZ_71820 [Dictyobacter formicarum]
MAIDTLAATLSSLLGTRYSLRTKHVHPSLSVILLMARFSVGSASRKKTCHTPVATKLSRLLGITIHKQQVRPHKTLMVTVICGTIGRGTMLQHE